GFAYCDFVRRNGGAHDMVASVSPLDQKLPMPTQRSIRRGAKVKHHQQDDVTASTPAAKQHAAPPPAASGAPAASAPVAAPTAPVTAAPLPQMGETGMRGSQ